MDFLSKYTSNPSILHYDRQARVVLRGHPPTFKIPGGQKISTKNAKEMKFLQFPLFFFTENYYLIRVQSK